MENILYQIKNKRLNQMKENSLKMTVCLLLKILIYTSIKENKFQIALNCSKAEVRILCSFLFCALQLSSTSWKYLNQ